MQTGGPVRQPCCANYKVRLKLTPLFLETVEGKSIEEGRAVSKSPHKTFGYFLSIPKQQVSAVIIQNSAVWNFSPKTEGTKTKAARCLFFLMSFPFLYILNSLQYSLTVYILQSLSACLRDCRGWNRNGRKVQLGPGKCMAKTRFGLEK
jgi:hypothetical protein